MRVCPFFSLFTPLMYSSATLSQTKQDNIPRPSFSSHGLLSVRYQHASLLQLRYRSSYSLLSLAEIPNFSTWYTGLSELLSCNPLRPSNWPLSSSYVTKLHAPPATTLSRHNWIMFCWHDIIAFKLIRWRTRCKYITPLSNFQYQKVNP